MNSRIHKIIILGASTVLLGLLLTGTASAATQSLFDETKTLQDGDYWTLTADLVAEVVYTIDIESTEAVDLVVLDDVNFGKYDQAASSGTDTEFQYFSDYSSLSVKAKSYTIQLAEDMTLNFVVENFDYIEGGAAGGAETDVSLSLTYDDEDPAIAPGFGLFMGLAGMIVAATLIRKNIN